MQEKLHDHINQELTTNTTTDTVFIAAAIGFNFLMGCIGASAAAAAAQEFSDFKIGAIIVYAITLILTLIVNAITIIGLITGRRTRGQLSGGLLKMYEDAKVNQYYDSALLTNYDRRYILFIAIVAVVGLASAAIPLVILIFF